MSMANTNVSLPYDSLPSKNYSEELRTELEKLQVISDMPFISWTANDIYAACLTHSQFLKSIRIITSVADNGVRAALLQLGVKQGFFSTETPSVDGLYKFCKWLRTRAGDEEMKQTQHDMKMSRRAKAKAKGFTAEAVACLKAFNIQMNDWRNHNKFDRMTQYDDDMKYYAPASIYKELKGEELTNVCYEMYVAECRAMNVFLYIDNSNKIKTETSALIFRYGKDAREQHVMSFLHALPESKEQLKSYLGHNIDLLSSKGNMRRAASLGCLIRSMDA